MLGDKICHVRHAAVAQFYVVIVANLVQSMSGRKDFSLQSAEFPTDVGANMFTIIWWVELYNSSFSRSSFVWVKTRFIFECAFVPAPAHRFFIVWGGFCEFFVVARNIGKAFR